MGNKATIDNVNHPAHYNTGNIDYQGDVHIHGDVRGTFTVKATGNITIDGLVEAAYIPGEKFACAVQWHPEFFAPGDPLSEKIFESFVTAACEMKVYL